MPFRPTRSLLWPLLAACLPAATLAAPADEANPLATLRPEHPRLLFTADEQKQIEEAAKNDPLLARLIEQNRVNATAMLDQPPVKYEIPDGKRLLAQSRYCIERVAAMAMAHRLSGERRFADAAVKEMLVTTKFKDFNPPHFLDTAEMTTALAVGYDWLYGVISPDDRKTIREAIVRLGLEPGMKVYEKGGWWTRGDNNWNQVCNGGMILGALAVAEDEPELARKILVAARKSVPAGVSVYAPDGAYPEGPGYWQYGTEYTCLTIKGLRTALGSDFGLAETPGLDRTGRFRIQTIGPTGLYFNYADCGLHSRPASAMFLLARLYDPLFAWWHREELQKCVPAGEIRSVRLDRFFPLEIAWYDGRGQKPSAEQLPPAALLKGRQDLVTMRSAWGEPSAIFVGLKAGDNRTNHGHLDVGSFVLDAGGVRWAGDFGGDDYNMPGYFGGKRWNYYRLNNRSHNTLVIDDKLQNAAARCSVVAFHSAADRTGAIVDMTEAYKGQVASALRGVELLDRRVVRVQDELTGLTGEVRWGMVTPAEVRIDANKATLSLDGRRLQAEILAPQGTTFEIVSTKPPTKQEQQNEGTRMLVLRAKGDGAGRLVIDVVLQSLGKEKPLAPPALRPLAEWPK
jgi:hypothetical protein